jgi:hypothetical protein
VLQDVVEMKESGMCRTMRYFNNVCDVDLLIPAELIYPLDRLLVIQNRCLTDIEQNGASV